MTLSTRDESLSETLACVAFLAGIVVPGFFAAYRVFVASMRNWAYAGASVVDQTRPSEDMWLWVTAVVMTLATAVIAWRVLVEARHGTAFVPGLILGTIAAAATWTNWYVVTR